MRGDTVDPLVETFGDAACREGVCVADGYGISVRVERGHLVVADGIAEHRRERRFARATCRLERLVVLGHAGSVTLEALRWCADVGVAYVHLDVTGRVLATSGVRGNDDARLRRAQALAPTTGLGLAIARALVGAKLEGQARVAQRLRADVCAEAIREHASNVAGAVDIDAVRSIEAQAAVRYWAEAWGPLPIPWVRRDLRRVPAHWRTFGARGSALRGESGPRRATTPANAVLNYLYALAEAECQLALCAVGLDPGLGWLHADQRNRDSAALDVLEALRPDVDAYVADLIMGHVFSRRDFAEARNGTVRVLAPLTHRLAETLPAWRARAARVVEAVAQALADEASLGRLPTLLTEANRSAGRDATRRRPRCSATPRVAVLPRRCETCGAPLTDRRRRRWCTRCAASHTGVTIGEAVRASVTARRGARAAGKDPAQSRQARAKVGRANRARAAERQRWEAAHPVLPDPQLFTDTILPAIRDVPLGKLAKATGLSKTNVSEVRRGRRVPHPMHWEALARAADTGGGPSEPSTRCTEREHP
ncbi:MAG: CRISPR-associated endonuclease Cas1 [Acidimicrobiia bacterium]